jgi:hypothetical protein
MGGEKDGRKIFQVCQGDKTATKTNSNKKVVRKSAQKN